MNAQVMPKCCLSKCGSMQEYAGVSAVVVAGVNDDDAGEVVESDVGVGVVAGIVVEVNGT